MKFKVGDIIKCVGEHFTERRIVRVDTRKRVYVTEFLEDRSIVSSPIETIDTVYRLKK